MDTAIDFAAVRYLGWQHPSGSLPDWERLSTGLPAALQEPAAALYTAARLARLQGCRQAVLAPSTLHLFWDLFGEPLDRSFSGRPLAIYLDAGAYPIARWGVERAAGRGARVRTFPHHDAGALQTLLRQVPSGRQVVVVCDGVSARSGRAAPLPAYLQALPSDGLLVVDDTQALGLLGAQPGAAHPYGRGGGGSLRFHGLQDERVLLVCSLAKGFGVPLAALSGSRGWIEAFRRASETRLHCSPPSLPVMLAAARALALNAACGDRLRRRLAQRVRFFRSLLARLGLAAYGGLFPVQSVHLPPGAPLEPALRRLQRAGLRPVPRLCEPQGRPCLSFVLNARHKPDEIAYAAQTLAGILRSVPAGPGFSPPVFAPEEETNGSLDF